MLHKWINNDWVYYTNESVMIEYATHMKEEYHKWICYTQINQQYHTHRSCHTSEWIMSSSQACECIHVNESCHTCERVMSSMHMSNTTHINHGIHIRHYIYNTSHTHLHLLHIWDFMYITCKISYISSHIYHMWELTYIRCHNILHLVHIWDVI